MNLAIASFVGKPRIQIQNKSDQWKVWSASWFARLINKKTVHKKKKTKVKSRQNGKKRRKKATNQRWQGEIRQSRHELYPSNVRLRKHGQKTGLTYLHTSNELATSRGIRQAERIFLRVLIETALKMYQSSARCTPNHFSWLFNLPNKFKKLFKKTFLTIHWPSLVDNH